MTLNDEFFEKIVAKIVKKGEPDDLTKFVLSGNESLAAAQRYFNLLKANEKKVLYLKDDTWCLSSMADRYCIKAKKHAGLSLFKTFASSIIPFIEELSITNTHLKDYSFLKDIKHLYQLNLGFKDQEYEKVLSGLSTLQSVDELFLDIKGLNLQLLNSLAFSFGYLEARNFTFEVDSQCSKIFQTQIVNLYGDKEAMNDFVFTRENFQHYATLFPNATDLKFEFYIKITDDVSDLVKVSNPNHAAEVNIDGRNIEFGYDFFDYSGFPESKVVELLQNDEDWNTEGCPYTIAFNDDDMVENVTCSFPLAVAEVDRRIAKNTVRRIPENSIGSPEDYYRLIIENDWGHKAEFEVLKTVSVKRLLKTYRKITGIYDERFGFGVYGSSISNGTIADNFQDGAKVFFFFKGD